MSINVPGGSPLPLSLLLFDGDVAKFPVAHVYDFLSAPVTGSPFTLTHSANGRYINSAFTPAANGKYTALYITYNEVGHTTEALEHARVDDYFEVDDRVSEITATLLDTGTTLPATLATLETKVQADARQGILVAEHNAIQGILNTQETKAEADARQALLISEHNATQATLGTVETKVQADSRQDLLIAEHDASQGTLATLETKVQADANQAVLVTAHNTTQSNLAIVDGIVDSILVDTGNTIPTTLATLETKAEADARQVLLTGGHSSIQGDIAALNNVSTLQVTNAVWNELSASHVISGSFGEFLDGTITSRATQVSVDGIQNNTNFVAILPQVIERPPVGSVALDVYVRLYNTAGSPSDPDLNIMNIRVELTDGTITVPTAAMTRINTGEYEVSLTVNDTDDLGYRYFFFEYVVSAVNFSQVRVSVVAEDADIQTQILDNTNAILTDTTTAIPALLALQESKIEADTRQVSLIAEHDATQATLTTQETKIEADSRQAILITEHDATQLTLAGVETKAEADIRQALLIIEHDDTHATLATQETKVQADARQAALISEHDDTQVTLATIETKSQADARQVLLISEHDVTQAGVLSLSNKIGTPVAASVSADNAAIKARVDLLETESSAGIRAIENVAEHDSTQLAIGTLSSGNQLEHDQTQADILALSTKVGTPTGISVSDDNAAIQARVDLLETEASALTRDNNSIAENAAIQAQVDILQTEASALARANTSVIERLAIQSRVDLLETSASATTKQVALIGEHNTSQGQITALDTKIGAPAGTTVSADIAAIQATTDTLETEANALVRDNNSIAENAAIQARVDLLETDSSAQTRYNDAFSERGLIQARVDLLETESIAEGRSNATIAEHLITQDKIDSVVAPGGGLTLDNIADAVWDEILSGPVHDTPGSAGLLLEVVNQQTQSTLNEISSSPSSLSNILLQVTNTQNLVVSENNQNEVKIDALTTLMGVVEVNLTNEIGINRSGIATVDLNVSNSRIAVIAEIDQNEVKIDAIDSKVSGIQNNTDVVVAVPDRMVIPDLANSPKTYQLVIETFTDAGVPVNTDSLPTITIYNTDGSVHSAEANTTQDGAKVGVYLYDVIITDAQVAKPLRIEAKTIIATVTKYSQRPSEFVAYDGTLESIEVKVDAIGLTTVDSNNLLTGANGLSNIKTEVLTNRTEINNNEVKIDGIKTVTDALPTNIATEADTTMIENLIIARPTTGQVQAQLDNQTDSIKGLSSRDLTEVYDNEKGTDNALLASDPRLNNLDAAISTRSTLTDAEVWAYATRELTASAPISNIEIAKIWDYLTANLTIPGSVGKLISDNIDIAISTRSDLTVGDLAILLTPIAKETTLNGVSSTVVNENNENQILITQALALLNNIKPQTDKIVVGGAQEGTVISGDNSTQSLITGLDLDVTAIRSKTDNLPNSPAQQGSVLAIPQNPLLDSDPRLDLLNSLPLLDVAVSTRAESFPNDYATKTDLDNTETNIIAEVNINEVKIDALPPQSYFDPKFSGIDYSSDFSDIKGAGFNTVVHSLVKIKEGQVSTPGGTTPQAIWEYATRSLTDYPDFATPGDVIQGSVDTIDALTNTSNRMTSTIDVNTDEQVILCWMDINGSTNLNPDAASISVRNESGVAIWAGTTTSHVNGVFKITKSGILALIGSGVNNFTVEITIEHQGQDYLTVQPFYIVG